MEEFKDFTNFIFVMYLCVIYAERLPTMIQAPTSKGQCTPPTTREIFIIMAKGRKYQNTFLYPKRKRATKNATLTLA